MKLTVVSHACLLVEAGAERLVIDPWIVGSCYWRSWWHYPEAWPGFDPASVTAIYYTHEHPDHLHFPSLRKFPQGVRILIPRFPVDRMAGAIHDRGYRSVEQIAHGGSAKVGPLTVTSYQYGLDDSVPVVSDGKTTVVDLNDAKLGGMAYAQILKRHPKIDFLLRSHSSAQAYPVCYTADDPKDLELLPMSYYTDSFAEAVASAKPRYAVPFASNVCHLHPETLGQNAHMISPEEVAKACRGKVGASEVVVMGPGDSWDGEKGFSTPRPRPERSAEIERLRASCKDKLAKSEAEEKALPPLDFEAFSDYMGRFVRAVPWPLRRLYPFRVGFAMPDGECFVVDLGRRSVEKAKDASGLHSVITADPRLLRDAVDKAGVNLVGISKRLKVHVRRGGLVFDAAFWGLLTVWELSYLPLPRTLKPRGVSALARRWRELAGYVPVFLDPGRSLERVIESAKPRAAA